METPRIAPAPAAVCVTPAVREVMAGRLIVAAGLAAANPTAPPRRVATRAVRAGVTSSLTTVPGTVRPEVTATACKERLDNTKRTRSYRAAATSLL